MVAHGWSGDSMRRFAMNETCAFEEYITRLDESGYPMKKIVLIACSKDKARVPCAVQDLYVSPLFRRSLAYARKLEPDAIYILSAKHWLLDLADVVAPYNCTLNGMDTEEVKAWSVRVLVKLRNVSDPDGDRYVFLAGKQYYTHIIKHLKHPPILPLEHLSIGRRLAYLKANT